MPQVVLTVNDVGSGYPEIEHQQGHGDGENAIAQGGESFHVLARDFVV